MDFYWIPGNEFLNPSVRLPRRIRVSMEDRAMKLRLIMALAVALVSSVSPVLAQTNHSSTSHLHAQAGFHDRSPRPHIHESQPHH